MIVWTHHASQHATSQSNANDAHGLAGQFGPKGYEDDRALYLYLRQNFMDAFNEVSLSFPFGVTGEEYVSLIL